MSNKNIALKKLKPGDGSKNRDIEEIEYRVTIMQKAVKNQNGFFAVFFRPKQKLSHVINITYD